MFSCCRCVNSKKSKKYIENVNETSVCDNEIINTKNDSQQSDEVQSTKNNIETNLINSKNQNKEQSQNHFDSVESKQSKMPSKSDTTDDSNIKILKNIKKYENIENIDLINNSKSICHTDDNESVDLITANGDLTKACISRRNSSKSSILKKVNINDSAEIIPSSEIILDDDEVFSDSVPPKLPRGDMCAPYILKQGSFSTCYGLPDWFDNDERFHNEYDGSQEPPVTPVGRDELALKRHRMYSELLLAAQAAVEHRVRFNPLGPDIATADCDADLKSATTLELENLVNRLEKLIDRLERVISTREFDITNETFNSLVEIKRKSNLEKTNHNNTTTNNEDNREENKISDNIENIKTSSNHINSQKEESIGTNSNNNSTVLKEYLSEDNHNKVESLQGNSMSVNGYQDIINGPLSQYITFSNKIGGDVAKHAQLVKAAFDAQLQYVNLASQYSQPSQDKQVELLKPTSYQITAIQDFREKNRASPLFNHLSAISESIPALAWVCVTPTPGPHVKEMNDAGQFYTNRVLKEWKDKNSAHVEWARSWIQTLTDLQKYIKQYHTTGLVWSGKNSFSGGAPPPPPPSALGCPPPPPPPVAAFDELTLSGGTDDRSALFAEINQGEGITKNLKKVTADMQTHKNPTLRTGPAPFKAPQYSSSTDNSNVVQQQQVDRQPVFIRDGKKWLIEYQKSNQGLIIENAEMNNVVYMFKCQNSTLTIKGKVNSVVMDSCKKCSLLFDSVVSSIEFVNCQSCQMQVLGKVPTISIDKTDGCQMYLSKDSFDVEIISSKSSEMNVLIPKENGDYIEQPIPEQYKTRIHGNTLQTTCVENLG